MKSMDKISEVAVAKIVFFPFRYVVPVLAFAVPLLISGPQLLTGSLVNSLLFLSAVNLPRKNLGLIAIAPSIGALLNGLIFGRYTPFLVYFLPFIWISNLILMRTYLSLNNRHFVLKIAFPAILKALFLFLVAFIFFKAGIVPKIFLTAMGVVQLLTAIVGGLLFLLASKFVKKP